MRKEIINRLETAIDDIFWNIQEEWGIESGDITPELSLELDTVTNNLAAIIEKVLERQMEIDDEKQAIEYRYKKEIEYDERMK